MEPRNKPGTRNRTRGVDENAPAPLALSNIAELIGYGQITVGALRPVGCVAVANDEDNCLAMLVRRKGEPLAQLLARLDLAIAKALTEDIFTDEVNPPPSR